MRLRVLIISAALLLSGCKLLPDPNALLREGNTVTVKDIDLAITLDPDYSYLNDYDDAEYSKYLNAPGGTTHNFKRMIFTNTTDKSFIVIEKRTCNRCRFKNPESNVPESDGPGSFLLGNKRILKWYDVFSNPATEDLQISSEKAEIFFGEFNTRSYGYGFRQFYLVVTVVSPVDRPLVKIEDVVKLAEI